MDKKLTRREILRLGTVGGIGAIASAYLGVQPIKAARAQQVSLAKTMADAANKFLESLDSTARSKATFAFDDAERVRWHWTTPRNFPRNGLPLRDIADQPRELAMALLRSGTSEMGYQKVLDIISLQNDLGNDPLLYFVSVFGTPGSTSAPWGWRFEGHHISRQFTIVGEQVALTPFFLGAWPTINGAKLRAMPREEDAARELARSLEGTVREAGLFDQAALGTHVTQNQPRVQALDPIGVPISDLNADQQALAMEIMETYLGVLPDEISKAHLDKIHGAGLDQIRFGWAGSLEPRRSYYYRLQGTTFLLEHDNSRNGASHIHSVWRVFDEDFGYDLLK
jgi:hypothetical protein